MSLYHFQCVAPWAISFFILGIVYFIYVERGGRK